ncbi:GyrI-like small molecule binding domain-containing protein [Alkalitalea saponilacus]|uniref:GyrI-like small molecule binding domain-containing protein n=2 Tax=Alkalitalea saponilacus TaxID=889453 RepID=A0A1T5HRV8_9BACT|nr:GyrI-like small molecule binding domain-containing protein [Alkalitalea saponilacus]
MSTILIILSIILIGLLLISAWYGGFYNIRFKTTQCGGETVAFLPHKGDYKRTGKVMDEVYYTLLNEFKIETFKGVSIYYDDPDNTPTSELRSEVGCVIENPDLELIEKISQKFQVKVVPKREYLTTEFPYKGKPSVIVGVIRVYPAIKKQTRQNNLPENGHIMEIYDIPNKKIVYRKAMEE